MSVLKRPCCRYRQAVRLGVVSYIAELAWLLLWGRGGVAEDKRAAFRAAQEVKQNAQTLR